MNCNREKNIKNCNCTSPGCSRKGICCECVQYHLKNNKLPACFFSKESEKTLDRSFINFARDKGII